LCFRVSPFRTRADFARLPNELPVIRILFVYKDYGPTYHDYADYGCNFAK